jgi:hypothetical protein
MDSSLVLETRRPAASDSAEHDPDAHWAIPALQRLQALPPPASGVVGHEHYFMPPPLCIPERQLPPPPQDQTDSVAMRKWLDHCWALRNLYGSGN